MEYGWAGSGSYITSPIVALSTELTGLGPSSGDVLAVSAPFANTQGAIWADIEFIAGGPFSPVGDAFIDVWVLRSLDGGGTFEDGSPTAAPARGPDISIPVNPGTNVTPRAGAPGLMLPPGTFKIAVRNQMGAAIPAGSTVRFSIYAEGSGEDIAAMTGDVGGTLAYRIADMMERFGVQTYSQSSLAVNPWGAGTSDYTTSSVIQALTWLTANSGMICNLREYHLAGRDTGGGANQLSWCPTVATATGSKFSVALARGGGTADAATLSSMAVSSANGAGWMSWAEGLATPNDGSVTAANCVATQQALYTGVGATRTATYPVATAGPSYTYNTLPPETSTAIANYLDATQKANLLASTSLASVRFFPTLNPERDDSAGRGGNADDVALGHSIYFGKPLILSEWHPTQLNADSPSHAASDEFASYYAALMMLNAHRLGYEAWFWKSLFDIGRSGESPWTRVGLFPNAGSDTPRLPARTIRAMYALTGDSGAKKRSFRTSRLDYTVTGLPAPPANATPWMGGHHRLFQNSGGTFFIFIWNEQLPLGGSGTTVTLSFIRSMSRVVHYDLTTDPTNAETPVATLSNISSVSFTMTASVHLFVITPQGSVTPTESAQGATLTSTFGAIYDANGVAFTLVNNPPFGMQVSHGGITDSQNVVLLLYWDHRVHQQTSTGSWAYWSGSAWVSEPGDPRIQVSESPDGLSITGPGTTIYASQTPGSPGGATLDQWTINSSAQMVLNGTPDGNTANVMEAYYHNHIVYMQTTTGNNFGTPGWSQWSGSVWNVCPNPKGVTESPEGTQVTTAGPTVNASATPGTASSTLHIFTLIPATGGMSDFQVSFDGVRDTVSDAVNLLYYHNHTLYQRAANPSQYSTPGWWVWNGGGIRDWVDCPDPTAVAGPTETTDGTTVTGVGVIVYASRTPGTASSPGAALDEFAITSNRQITLNGTLQPITAAVLLLYYAGHYIYHQASNPNQLGYTPGWWRWEGGPDWIDVAPPTTSGQQSIVIATIPQQVIGTPFSVNGTLSGYSSPPSLQYRDDAGSWLAFPSGSLVTATSFSLAHPAFAGTPTSGAPPQAAAQGFNTLILSADFTSASQVSADLSGGTIARLYPFSQFEAPITDWSVTNGALIIRQETVWGWGISTAANHSAALSSPSSHGVNIGNGLQFHQGYLEADIGWDWTDNTVRTLWSDTFTNSTIEIDVMEQFGGQAISALHEWTHNGGTGTSPDVEFSGPQSALVKNTVRGQIAYNKFALLWTSNFMQIFINDQPGPQVSCTAALGWNVFGGSLGPPYIATDSLNNYANAATAYCAWQMGIWAGTGAQYCRMFRVWQ